MAASASWGWIAASLIAWGADAAAQPLPDRIRLDVSVTVNGEPLTELQQDDFILREEKIPRPIAAMTRADLPLDIVLICPSEPTGGDGPEYVMALSRLIQSAAANILRSPHPDDRIAFISHGPGIRLEIPFTNRRESILGAVRTMAQSLEDNRLEYYRKDVHTVVHAIPPAWSSSAAMRSLAVDYAVSVLAEAPASGTRQKLIVMINELSAKLNKDTYAGTPDEPVIQRLWQEGIVLTAVGGGDREPFRDPTRRQPEDASYRRNNPMHIAHATGGDAIVPKDPRDIKDLEGVLARTRQRYILSFDQPNGLSPGQERKISIDLSMEARKRYPDAVVQVRTGYVTR